MADSTIITKISGDASGLVSALEKGKQAVSQFGSGVGKIADGIGRKFEFRDISRTLATTLGISLTSIADRVARTFIGFSKESEASLEKLVASTEKAADAQIAQLERVRKAQAAIERERLDAAERTRQVIRDFLDDGRRDEAEAARAKAKLDQENDFAEDLRWVKEQDRIAAEKKLKLAAIEQVKKAEIAAAEEASQYKKALLENEMQQHEDLRNSIIGFATERTLLVGGRAFGKSRDPEAIKNASDEELRELIRRQKQDIGFVEGQKGQGPTALADAATNFLQQGTVIARLQTDINRAMQELGLRNGLRSDFAFGGESGARGRFQGDPLAFDRLFQQFVKDNRTTQDLLVQIDDRLRGGIPTLTVDTIPGG